MQYCLEYFLVVKALDHPNSLVCHTNPSVNSAVGKSIPNTSVNKAVGNQSPNHGVKSGVKNSKANNCTGNGDNNKTIPNVSAQRSPCPKPSVQEKSHSGDRIESANQIRST